MFTLKMVDDEDQITTSGTAADGSPISNKFEVPDKGGAGKYLAGPLDAVSGKVINDNTRNLSEMKGGKEMVHLHSVVSKDGRTMTITVKRTNAQRQPCFRCISLRKTIVSNC